MTPLGPTLSVKGGKLVGRAFLLPLLLTDNQTTAVLHNRVASDLVQQAPRLHQAYTIYIYRRKR